MMRFSPFAIPSLTTFNKFMPQEFHYWDDQGLHV